jgi:hypothetical protein
MDKTQAWILVVEVGAIAVYALVLLVRTLAGR